MGPDYIPPQPSRLWQAIVARPTKISLICENPGGAKGIRTPDPHTASVVRYQLRHSPRCISKLHQRRSGPKTSLAGATCAETTKTFARL